MGSSGSKHKVVNHSVLPVDQVPYSGPQIEYCMVDVPVKIKNNISFTWAQGQTMSTSDVDTYYSVLAERYGEGFSLISFFQLPEVHSSGFTSAVVPFKGVFSRQLGQQSKRPFQLRIHKSMIHLHLLGVGVLFGGNSSIDANISHVYNLITQEISTGGRFLCMEFTGGQTSQGLGAAVGGVSPAMGLDVFFEVPEEPSPTRYTIQAVGVPIHLNYKFGFGAGTVDVVCDWLGTLAQYLNQGWRLSDIFVASPDHFMGGSNRYHTPIYNINTIWFFEKEVSKLHDNTPMYEGTVIEFYVRVKVGFGSVSCNMDLGPVLAQMGSCGWELVCTVPTPKIVNRSFTSITMVMMLVFQRPIVGSRGAQYPPLGGNVPTSTQFGIRPHVEGAAGGMYPGNYPGPSQTGFQTAAMPPGYEETQSKEKPS